MKSIFDKTDAATIIARINALQAGSVTQWGKMTVGQMVRHCIKCEEYYFGNVQVKRSPLGRLVGRMAIKSILKDDNSSFRKNSSAPPQFRVTGDITDLEDEKAKWKSLIARYASYDKDHFNHWFFGRLTREQMGQFVYKHCDHHLRQFSS